MVAGEEDWARAADVVEARMSELGLNRMDLARIAGIDRKTVDNFLTRHVKPQSDKRGGWERALQWAYGSLLAVARGGEAKAAILEFRPGVETVSDADEALDFVATGKGGERGISDEEVLRVIRETRERLDELERRLSDGRT